jgi:hypothetical protein
MTLHARSRFGGRRRAAPGSRHRQRGWVGMIVLLLALLIVAWLAKDALHKYGLVPDAETVTRSATGGARTGSGAAGAVENADPTAAIPAPTNPLDKARGVESMIKQQEDKRSGGY